MLSLQLPPGMHRNGTDLESTGRWIDGSLVRWYDGVMQPVGGWRRRVTSTVESAPRGAIAWQDNSGDRWVAFGTYEKLFVLSAAGVLSDITPAGFVDGSLDASVNTGFGGSFFGTGHFGDPRPDTGNYGEATTWSMATWGEYLIACSNADGKIYEWQLDVATPAAALSTAPTNCAAAIVTAERFVMALGAGADPRKVQWCDREDNTTWTPASTNEAGSQVLETPGQIMGAVQVRGQTLILTDNDAFVANYVGPPFVYGFERVGSSCGTVSRKAVADVDGGAVWMGQNGFFMYRGGSVETLPCAVSDYVFNDISEAQQSKVHAVPNAQFGEIWWFYPSGSSNDCDKYVVLNYRTGEWWTGNLSRTTGVDRGVFRTPIWTDTVGTIYDHETGANYDGAMPFAESGPFMLGDGETSLTMTSLLPDEKTRGQVTATFKARGYANSDERTFGPYTMDGPTDVRITARQIRIRIDGAELADWRWGVPRARVAMRGLR